MPAHSESRILPYTADFIYAIVADVERYPEFVPWCAGLRILKREPAAFGEIMWAETLIGYKTLRERYTSQVELNPSAGRIDVEQTQGPFRQLKNHWRFTPLKDESGGEGCEVEFSIAFEFKSRLLHGVAGHAFEKVMLTMADAFEARAATLSRARS